MVDDVLNINGLKIEFYTEGSKIPAVDDLSLKVNPCETIGIVGESGCGKSTTSLAIMRLLSQNNSAITGGSILFGQRDLVSLLEEEMRKIRGKDIAMIFQDPMTSLNPLYTIGRQLREGIMLHLGYSEKEAQKHIIKMLQKVNIPRPEIIVKSYPHELSGGMRQRVMIAMALACSPKLLIADEPTTALDVTVQAQILDLINDLKEQEKMSIILITHDLGIVAEMCQRVYVMYAGQIVEQGPIDKILEEPLHPYTKGLLASMPENCEEKERLTCIPGTVPLPGSVSKGCRFVKRCTRKKDVCFEINPSLIDMDNGREVRCLLYSSGQEKGGGANDE